jgi:CarboxypepD_reg-like domain
MISSAKMQLIKVLLLSSFIPILTLATSQSTQVQVIRGSIADATLKAPLEGANIVLLSLSPNLGTSSNAEGQFRIDAVPIGRHNLKVSFVGYKDLYLNNISVESGKETLLNIELEEDIQQANTVTIRAKSDKTKALNEFAAVSARQFSVEETRRFAASLYDPARMATAFAGVSSSGGDGNALVIRGNAPNGLLWRMEGVDVPNPNHFARVGTSGGGISILSAQLLSNSDFFTGAFPAEYGNALAGVFDIKLRKGNNEKREHTLAASIIGVDVATEGPFKKGYAGSYLINYRYGFLSLIQKLGLNVGDAPTEFQDLSFNINLPTKKLGQFSLFGFGGLSQQAIAAVPDSSLWKIDGDRRFGRLDASNTGAIGLTHSVLLGKKTAIKSIVALNGYAYREEDSRYERATQPLIFTRDNRFAEQNITFSIVANHKFSPQFSLRFGAYNSVKSFALRQREIVSGKLTDRINNQGKTSLLNTFAQGKLRFSERLSLLMGVQIQHLYLNQKTALEPRAAWTWALSSKQSLALGYGLHSQIQPLGNYFARVVRGKDTVLVNKNMGFTRAHHLVLAHNWQFVPNWNLKTELYYQRLFKAPITAGRATNFSLLNMDDDFTIDALENRGRGKNYGLELTLERYWTDQFYLLASLSLFESTYLASDGQWRNTRFNANTAATFLIGKEWTFKNRRNPSALGLDLRYSHAGGQRVVPIDLLKSRQQGRTITDPARIYDEKLPAFHRLDVQMEWRVQYPHLTGSTILGVQNATNHPNPIRQSYNAATKQIQYSYLAGIIPVLGYRVEF